MKPSELIEKYEGKKSPSWIKRELDKENKEQKKELEDIKKIICKGELNALIRLRKKLKENK